jgi:hypothetical protein
MVKGSVRGPIKCDRVVFGIAAKKDHLLFAPVGNPKAKYVRVKFYHRIDLCGVKHSVTNGVGLHAFRLPPALMLNDAGAQLNTPALWVNKSKTVSSARLVESVRLGHKPNLPRLQLLRNSIHIFLIAHTKRDMMQARAVRGVEA